MENTRPSVHDTPGALKQVATWHPMTSHGALGYPVILRILSGAAPGAGGAAETSSDFFDTLPQPMRQAKGWRAQIGLAGEVVIWNKSMWAMNKTLVV